MALSDLQKRTAQAIVQIFETSSVLGDCGMVTLLPGDTGHLTYGKLQATLGSGRLYFLIKDYVEADGASLARKLRPFLPRLERKDTRLDNHNSFKRHLRNAGDDPVMRKVQDAFFDRTFWEPTLASADWINATTVLGHAVIFDSRIHGSWHHVRDTGIADFGSLSSIGEKKWMKKYVAHRRNWLATHDNAGLHATTYRMDALAKLIADNDWSLALPLTVRGQTISERTLKLGSTPPRASAEPFTGRLLRLIDPQMIGEDVRELQKALKAKGYSLTADGILGAGTDVAIKDFQSKSGLSPDGVAGAMTREALGLF